MLRKIPKNPKWREAISTKVEGLPVMKIQNKKLAKISKGLALGSSRTKH